MRRLAASLAGLTRRQVYVGIPATTAEERLAQVRKLLSARRGKRARVRLAAVNKAAPTVNNAELMFIHTNGSLLRHIPRRPIVEPAIEDRDNADAIAAELRLAGEAALGGKDDQVLRQLKLAGQVAENAVKAWFTNPRNGWAPNKPSTIRAKGSSRPLIDTGALRQAVRSVVVEQ